MSPRIPGVTHWFRAALQRLRGVRDYLLLWSLLAAGLWLARPRAGAEPDEYWLFTIWTVLLLSLGSHVLRARREISADQPVP